MGGKQKAQMLRVSKTAGDPKAASLGDLVRQGRWLVPGGDKGLGSGRAKESDRHIV